jgi:hypothetical protein
VRRPNNVNLYHQRAMIFRESLPFRANPAQAGQTGASVIFPQFRPGWAAGPLEFLHPQLARSLVKIPGPLPRLHGSACMAAPMEARNPWPTGSRHGRRPIWACCSRMAWASMPAGRHYADSRAKRLGSSRLRIIVEAFRPLSEDRFRTATAGEPTPRIAAYGGHE